MDQDDPLKERATKKGIKREPGEDGVRVMAQKQGREGQCSCFLRSLILKLAWLPGPSFKVKLDNFCVTVFEKWHHSLLNWLPIRLVFTVIFFLCHWDEGFAEKRKISDALFKLDLKERVTANEIKCKPVQTAAVDLLPNDSYAKANVSLLAPLLKLSTATLTTGAY